MHRLNAQIMRGESGLAVIWGRRRVGKTRLLLEWSKKNRGLYTVADQSAPAIQRSYFAESVSNHLQGFDQVVYPDWKSLFRRLTHEAANRAWRGPVIFDEFPYLVGTDKAFESIFQNWIDHDAKRAGLLIAIAGSSQRMMQGLVLNYSAPLYGRASTMIELKPLLPGFLRTALQLTDDIRIIESYAVWGGIPRYWEFAAEYGDKLDLAVDQCVLDPLSPLHREPDRLLLEEMPPATALRPLLDSIGAGSHRVSEIAGRLQQPVTSLSRPLSRLIELGLIRRELPFGESEKSSKRSLYRISDPFIRFWFRIVAPNRSFLAESPSETRLSVWLKNKPSLFAETWEELCRQSVPQLQKSDSPLAQIGPWGPARRYWRGNSPEWDLVARSLDGKRLLLGEVKYHAQRAAPGMVRSAANALLRKGVPDIPGCKDCDIVHAVFFPHSAAPAKIEEGVYIVTAATVLACLS